MELIREMIGNLLIADETREAKGVDSSIQGRGLRDRKTEMSEKERETENGAKRSFGF